MEILRGIPVSSGVAIGPALILDTEGVRIPLRRIPAAQVDAELQRLHNAIASAAAESRENQRVISDRIGRKYGAVFPGML